MPKSTSPGSSSDGSARPRIVVAGGGFAGLETAFYLRMRLGDRAAITLVSDKDHFLFKPNTIYIPFGKDPQDLRVPLAEPARKRGIEFVQARVNGIDPKTKQIKTDGATLPYDYAVLATGATMKPEELPGLKENANTIWTVDEMLRLRASLSLLVDQARQGKRARVLFLVPPNNKCSGPLYEMVLMLETWLGRKKVRDLVTVAFATYEAHFIQAFGPRLHGVVQGEFQRRGIQGHNGRAAKRVDAGAVVFQDDSRIEYDLLVSFPAYVVGTLFPNLPVDVRGFIATEFATRQVKGHPDVYAVGDTGDFPVKQAFLAFLQGDAAGEHLASRILGDEPRLAYEPVSMCIMEQFDQATFAQVPLRLSGNPDLPVEVDPAHIDLYKVGTGKIWQVGKKMLGVAIPFRFKHGEPFHAGATWATMEAGLNVMKGVLTK